MTLAAETKSVSVPGEPSATILVVDDTEANRDVLVRRLQRRGYQVIPASDGKQALDAIAEQSFDLILLDVMMPGISGLEVLRQIRTKHDLSDLPVIMATAKDRAEDVVQALELGANDYVTKPLDFDVVLARVRTHTRLRRSVQQIKQLEQQLQTRNDELEQAAKRTAHELQLAARVQSTYLPSRKLKIDGLDLAWEFKPCQQLAGDSINIVPLNSTSTAIYVLDVAGHGAAASLQAVAATRLLGPGPESLLKDAVTGAPLPPQEVLSKLNESFGWNPATEQFLTAIYCVYDRETRELAYCSAGHPPPIRISKSGVASLLEGSGLPIGFSDGYKSSKVTLDIGDRVYLYSDGAIEAKKADLQLFGKDRLIASASALPQVSLQQSVEQIIANIEQWAGAPLDDDLSIVAFELHD